jgi:hypothetical protein
MDGYQMTDRDFSGKVTINQNLCHKALWAGHWGLICAVSRSRQKRGEGNLWQRRFWEHLDPEMNKILQHIAIIFMTIQCGMVSVKILKIGNIPVSIGLSLKEFIPAIRN